jgi:hypothetical protein
MQWQVLYLSHPILFYNVVLFLVCGGSKIGLQFILF